jgi:hypothetical protein
MHLKDSLTFHCNYVGFASCWRAVGPNLEGSKVAREIALRRQRRSRVRDCQRGANPAFPAVAFEFHAAGLRLRKTCRHQRRFWSLVIAVAALGVLGVLPAAALGTNSYGIAIFYGQNHHGTIMDIRTNSMSVPNVNTDAIANDSWVINTDTSPIEFIEAGIAKGNVTYQNCNLVLSRSSFFWADLRPNSAYYCHYGAVASFGTYYNDEIHYLGSGKWSVEVGSLSGTSTDSLTSESQDNAGLEETTQSGVSCGSSSSLSWFNGADGLQTGWTDEEFGDAHIPAVGQPGQDAPPYAYWVSQPNWLRAYSNTSC